MSEQESKVIGRPGSYDECFPGRFVKAGEFKGKDVTLTIDHTELELLPTDKGGQEVRGIWYFREKNKLGQPIQISMNRTRGECIKAMFGKVPSEWVGKRVTFYPTTDKLGRETVDCIRVRGSPDISAPIEFELKMPKRAPKRIQLVPTGKPASPATPPQS
jgi:hypothetical protein